MSTNLTTSFSFEDEKIQNFLFDQNLNEFQIEPPSEANFSNLEKDRLSGLFPPLLKKDCLFAVNEQWQVIQTTHQIPPRIIRMGINNVVVIKRQQVKVYISYWLFLSYSIIDESTKEKVREIFRSKDFKDYISTSAPNQTIDDFNNWIKTKFGDDITDDLFIIKNSFSIEKIDNAEDFNTEQRDTLLRSYGLKTGVQRNVLVIINNEGSLQDWSEQTGCIVRKIGEQLKKLTEPTASKDIVEVPEDPTNPVNADNIMNSLMSIIPTVDCELMKPHQIKLLTFAIWPEFKFEFVPSIIPVGCVKITIYLPVLRIRLARLEFFVYYYLPENTKSLF